MYVQGGLDVQMIPCWWRWPAIIVFATVVESRPVPPNKDQLADSRDCASFTCKTPLKLALHAHQISVTKHILGS